MKGTGIAYEVFFNHGADDCPLVDIISDMFATSLDVSFSALLLLTKYCFNHCIKNRLVLILVLPERNTNSMPVDCQWLIKDINLRLVIHVFVLLLFF